MWTNSTLSHRTRFILRLRLVMWTSVPLHFVIWFQVGLCLQHGAKIDVRDKKGFTPIHIAALHGHATVLSMLYLKKANLDVRDNKGRTPLMLACLEDNIIVHSIHTLDIRRLIGCFVTALAFSTRTARVARHCIGQLAPQPRPSQNEF